MLGQAYHQICNGCRAELFRYILFPNIDIHPYLQSVSSAPLAWCVGSALRWSCHHSRVSFVGMVEQAPWSRTAVGIGWKVIYKTIACDATSLTYPTVCACGVTSHHVFRLLYYGKLTTNGLKSIVLIKGKSLVNESEGFLR